MQELFISQFEYNHSLNQKLNELFLINADRISEQSVKLFSHILNAHHIWNSRIEQRQPTVGVWDITPMYTWQEMDRKNYEDSLIILSTHNLEAEISYRTSGGEPFTSYVKDILFHIINHSTHHRAQIAMEFRNAAIEPLVSDYIFYKRHSSDAL